MFASCALRWMIGFLSEFYLVGFAIVEGDIEVMERVMRAVYIPPSILNLEAGGSREGITLFVKSRRDCMIDLSACCFDMMVLVGAVLSEMCVKI